MERFRSVYWQVHEVAATYVLVDSAERGIERDWSTFFSDNAMNRAQATAFGVDDLESNLSVEFVTPGKLVPGSAHLPLLWLSRRKRHRYYWLIEDDVVYTGDWRELVLSFEGDVSDLLCSHITDWAEIPNWIWWGSLRAPIKMLENIDAPHALTKGFFPVYRLSERALSTILEYQRAGWSGHCEGIIPTILRHAGLSIADLNSRGLTPAYTTGTIEPGEDQGKLSSLRYRPEVGPEELRQTVHPLIFHPVKKPAVRSKKSFLKRALSKAARNVRKLGDIQNCLRKRRTAPILRKPARESE